MSKPYVAVMVWFVLAFAAFTGGCSNSAPPISVSLPASTPQGTDQSQAVALTATVANDRSNKGVTWTLTGPGSLSAPGALSITYNPPAGVLAASEKATITATSAADPTKTASVHITVNADPQIPFQTLANGAVGMPYSQPIALNGGTPQFQWSVYTGPIITGYKVGGALPDGLTLNPSSGVISGTPTGAGTWYFEMTVTDADAQLSTNPLSIQINPTAPAGNPIAFLNQPLVPTAVSPGSASFTLHASGTGFVSGATIDLNGTALATTFVDSQHLSALVPAASVASAGTAWVTIVNPGTGTVPSNVVYFQVGAPQATVTLATAANSSLQAEETSAVSVGDFNGDGKPDLAISANVQVYVFLGNGDGTFGSAAGSPMRVVSPPYDDFASPYVGPIAVGDFNHNGHLGMAVADIEDEAAAILLGNGDGTFSPSSATLANAGGFSVNASAAADFNGDGNLDLAFANFSGPSPVLLGYGDGAFTQSTNLNPNGIGFPNGVVVGDFNRDGKLDVVVANGGSKTYPNSGLAVSLGNGDGTFTTGPTSPISLGSSLSAVLTADFDGDGKLDIAVTDSAANTVIILLGNGDGTFGAPTTIPVGNNPYAIVAGDFNNDGKLDLAIVNTGDNTVTLLLGKGDGTFTPASGSPYPVSSGASAIAAADFNDDGKLDLAVAGNGTVSILLQQ
jgi:hypothetical protein